MLNYHNYIFHHYGIGPPNCTMSLTASMTGESAVIKWVIHTCSGALPTSYALTSYPVGVAVSEAGCAFINSSSIDQYEVTGLSPNTGYFIVLLLHDNCGYGSGYTVLAETVSGE